jgi:DNA-binding MarR family transcriptional regulator
LKIQDSKFKIRCPAVWIFYDCYELVALGNFLYLCDMKRGEFPVMTLFGRTLKFLTDEFDARLRAEDISVSIVEFVLLYRLSTMSDDEVTQQNFAQLEGKHKSVILRQIDKLEQRKLVARIPDQADRRKNNLALTKKGADLLDKLLAIENRMMKEMTKGLAAAEIETLKKVSIKIQHNALRTKTAR